LRGKFKAKYIYIVSTNKNDADISNYGRCDLLGTILNTGARVTTTPAPPRFAYSVQVKLANLGEKFQTPRRGSQDFENLANSVEGGFSKLLSKTPGFHSLDVMEFTE